jgi:manganese efflux pump family protein
MLLFIFNSILLGVGLAMDAFSVSIVNGMNETHMSKRKTFLIPGTYAFFQFAMPMIGWFCVHTISQYFNAFQKFIPWIALILLLYIGGSMLLDGLRNRASQEEAEASEKSGEKLTAATLCLQGIATSIDALSVGFTIAEYGPVSAFFSSLLIALTTFIICMFGLIFGKKFGEKVADHATVLGGAILIFIGLEIFVRGVF